MLLTPLRLPTRELTKLANATHLEQEPEAWPAEIVSASYKQHPFLAPYETDLELQRVDAARKYAVGRLLAYPAKMTKEAAAQVKRLVAFPVIVSEGEMSPLDVYQYNEQWHPFVEEKVQAILQSPATFDRPAPIGTFGGTDLTAQTDPGDVDRYGGRSLVKAASVLRGVRDTLREEDIEAFRDELRNDTGLRVAYLSVPSLHAAAEEVVLQKEVTAADHKAARKVTTPPTVLQFVEQGTGYKVKVANHRAFEPIEDVTTRFEVEKLLSPALMAQLRSAGHLTVVVGEEDNTGPVEKTAQVVNRVGIWTTRSGDKEITGTAIPAMMSLDGTLLDLHIFAGGDSHAMQEKVAGVFVADAKVATTVARGAGVFVYQEGAMGVATEPIIVDARVTTGEKEKTAAIHGRRATTGQPIVLSIVPGLTKIAKQGEGRYAIPDTLGFLPLNGAQVKVLEEGEAWGHLEKAASEDAVVLHANDTDSFWLTGAHAHSAFAGQHLDALGAEFALGALGVHERDARFYMEKAAADGRVRVNRTRSVDTAAEVSTAFMVKAAGAVARLPTLKRSMAPEAAALAMPGLVKVAADKETVDAVLSLGFINPENVALYVDYLPDLEKVASKLAEILVASRLGMDGVKETAARNALTQLTTVISGLRGLGEQVH